MISFNLNWIFLFILFWLDLAIVSVSIMIWWTKKVFFQTDSLGSKEKSENKWNS